jgi:redox-sensitive bicupin YhaK (pirin superfamily)
MPVVRALPAFEVMMGDHPLKQPLPTQSVDQIDPFLLIHHHANHMPAGTDRWNAGVGPHPHRGFSPVTFMWSGGVHHRDSRGNNSVVDDGGVQWMDAGLGIIHSERPPAKLAEEGGMQEIIQIWINTPSARKMDEPNYIPLQKDEMPMVPGHPDLRITSGKPVMNAAEGPLKSSYPITAAHGVMEAGVEATFEVQPGENGLFYLLDGSGRLEGYGLVEAHMLYQLDAGAYMFTPSEKTKVFFIAAGPINEKVESYGPFVMTNQTEIMEAMRDYQQGKMGFLVERDLP